MALVLCDGGETIVANYLVNKDGIEDLTLKLFQNDYTPVEASVVGSFTEATFTGYADVDLVAGDWTVTNDTASASQQTFTSSAGQTAQSVYGYYVVRTTSGELVWAERFTDGPYTIENNGDDIDVTLNITVS